MQPLSAYVHVPFCSHRCGYCNFTLVAKRDDLIEAYLEALAIELRQVLQAPRRVSTLFLGGGTPTHLPLEQLRHLLELITHWFPYNSACEFSCEANPLDCSNERLQLLREFGVNRLSIGGQSFSDTKLQRLERDHTGQQLLETLWRCSEIFNNLSLDLIFAAPLESLQCWQSDLSHALRTPIRHLSTYGLTIERGAAFFGRMLRQEIEELDSDLQLAMYETTIDTLEASGWTHYEVSNFAETGFQCIHNETYWRGQPWWAFGPGAASFLPSTELDAEGKPQFVRSINQGSTTQYIRNLKQGNSVISESTVLNLEQVVRERLVFGLRRLEGIRLDELDSFLGRQVRPLFEPYLSNYVEQGWLEFNHEQLRLTRKGLVISDGLWPDLLG